MVSIIQYITLISVPILIFGYIWYFIESDLSRGSGLEGIDFIMLGFVFGIPTGTLIWCLSTIALVLNIGNKLKTARACNLICVIIITLISFIILDKGFAFLELKNSLSTIGIGILVLVIALFNIYLIFFYKADNLQEEVKINNEQDTKD